MSHLKSVRITGLWGQRTVGVALHPKVNFLIGVNGSGKTTVLHLIASALTSDFNGLSRTPFTEIECKLIDGSEKEITVVVKRSEQEQILPAFEYTISPSSEQTSNYWLMNSSHRWAVHTSYREIDGRRVFDGESAPLNQYVKLKWLTVYRAPLKPKSDDQQISESSVDRRLTTLSNQLVRYFSKIAARRQNETNRFLRQMLAALAFSASEFNPFQQSKQLDLPALENAIGELMDTFLLGGADKARARLKEHFALAGRALAEKESYELDELVALAGLLPMRKVVEGWNTTQSKQDEIARPQNDFLNTLNSMYNDKKLQLNQRNELIVHITDDHHLPLSELSSGEKQLLILFAEALLQENSEFVYLADEPELSLHVNWQEQLTRNLLRINPSVQIIFATHSPDIVSEFGANTIDMESLVH